MIRCFSVHNQISYVQSRNIKAGLGDFVEVFPDGGDVDMLKALRTCEEVGYCYMISTCKRD